MTDRTIERLARSFHVRVASSRKIKSGVRMLVAPNGKAYALKRMRCPASRLRWMDRALRMTRRGFPAIAWRDPNGRDGRLLSARFGGRGAAYVLTPWIRGREPSPRSEQDLRACAAALARFHAAGSEAALSESGGYSLLGKWPSLLKGRSALIAKWVRRAKRGELRGTLGDWLRRHGDDLLRRAEEALALLKRSPYRELCESSSGSRALCHGDSGPKNFVLTREGPYLIDFETLRLDLRAYDLYRLIRLACKSGGWRYETAKTVLDGYQRVSRLKSSEFDMIKVWLLFPNKAYKILSRLDGPKVRNPRRFAGTLQAAASSERGLTSFLQDWDRDTTKG
ncbi:phosphotransferase [Cohnella sp. CFH 77786]|uniref:phosphotransferase n=1 Tax=Cohnella sp. CFH 77786 TaxID=2662265 RepID=UPI001C609BF8|nr:phosphotransferase [Cohnella sp. CFH 77786]